MQKITDEETEYGNSKEIPTKLRKISWVLTIFLAIYVIGSLLSFVMRPLVSFSLSDFASLNTIFTSILMQAFPFMLVGVVVSSGLHVFVPDEFIIKIFPAKYGLGYLTAMFVGIFFPVCECAIVPVMTRLVKKDVPLPVAVTFMLSAPIINPIVIVSTLYAFPGQPQIALLRVCFGLLIALIIGLLLSIFKYDQFTLLKKSDDETDDCCCCGIDHEDHDCNCGIDHEDHDCDCDLDHEDHICSCGIEEMSYGKKTKLSKIRKLFLHAGNEFFSVGKYLVIGALIASLIQTLIPESALLGITSRQGLSLFLMMAMAFLFSACSTSDAFIARSFANQMALGSIMGFMVFGPMLDIKNLLMLFAGFKKSFVLKLSLLIFILNFIILYFLAFLFL